MKARTKAWNNTKAGGENLSQKELAKVFNTSHTTIGKYERDEMTPSIDAAKKIADALETSLDYLTGDTKTPAYDKKTLQRLEDLQQLEEPKKQTLFDLMDTYIRDAKARKAYAS